MASYVIGKWLANKILRATIEDTPFQNDQVYASLHIATPDNTGSNEHPTAGRKLVSFPALTDDDTFVASSLDLLWSGVSEGDAIYFVGLWTESVGGEFLIAGSTPEYPTIIPAGGEFKVKLGELIYAF